MKKCVIKDWAGNEMYPGKVFDTIAEAWDFLTEDQHKRHPNVTDEEFDEIMGEFNTCEVEETKPVPVQQMDAFGIWMVESNIKSIKKGQKAEEVIATLRSNGYLRVADEVERRLQEVIVTDAAAWEKAGTAGEYVVWSCIREGDKIYNVSKGDSPQPNDGGYPNLEALMKLKGIQMSAVKLD